MLPQEEWVGNLQLLGFSSAVRALCQTLGGLMWIRPPWCSMLYKYRPAYCPGTEQRTRGWCGYSQLEAERVARAVSVMSRSSRGGRAPESVPVNASCTAQRSHHASARPSLPCLPLPAPAGLAQGSSAPLRPARSPCTVPPHRQPQGLGYVPVLHSCATLISSE